MVTSSLIDSVLLLSLKTFPRCFRPNVLMKGSVSQTPARTTARAHELRTEDLGAASDPRLDNKGSASAGPLSQDTLKLTWNVFIYLFVYFWGGMVHFLICITPF